MSLISFRTRVFLLVVVVAAVTASATAWLTVRQTTEQLTRSTELAQHDIERIVSDITTFGLVRADWQDVGAVVRALAEHTSQRVRLMSTDGVVILADSDPAAPAVPPRQTLAIDTRPPLQLGDIQPGSRASEAAFDLFGYGTSLTQARCWERQGVAFRVAKDPRGLNEFVQIQPGRVVPECTAPSFSGDEARALADTFGAACAPAQEAACVQKVFVERLADVTPPPAQVLIGTVDSPPPVRVNLRSVLAAAGLVALIAVVVSLLISRRVLRPIGALATASQRLGEGNLAERVPERGHDELTRLTQSFNRMAESLQRSKEQQHNMIADVAHELRTPLANIRGYLEALKDGVLPPDPELLSSLHEEAMLQQRLVDDLQELALAESGSLVYHPVRADLADLLQACCTAHAPAAGAHDVRIETDSPAPVFAVVDPDRFRQVVGNLITNAVRSTPADGVITLRSRAEGESAVVEVADTGSGIPAEDLPHVFDRFWRADAARGRETGGRGLGLAIAREIIAAHDGTVAVSSTAGIGTVFTVRLPLVR